MYSHLCGAPDSSRAAKPRQVPLPWASQWVQPRCRLSASLSKGSSPAGGRRQAGSGSDGSAPSFFTRSRPPILADTGRVHLLAPAFHRRHTRAPRSAARLRAPSRAWGPPVETGGVAGVLAAVKGIRGASWRAATANLGLMPAAVGAQGGSTWRALWPAPAGPTCTSRLNSRGCFRASASPGAGRRCTAAGAIVDHWEREW